MSGFFIVVVTIGILLGCLLGEIVWRLYVDIFLGRFVDRIKRWLYERRQLRKLLRSRGGMPKF